MMMRAKLIMQDGTQVRSNPADLMGVMLQALNHLQLCIMYSMSQLYQESCCCRPGKLTHQSIPLANLCNWLPDSGASSHMTPHLADLVYMEEELNLGVQAADGNMIKCTAWGLVTIDMTDDDNGFPMPVQLYDVIYIPGLKHPVTKFVNKEHFTVLRWNEFKLMFGAQEHPLSIPLANGILLASNAVVHQTFTVQKSQHYWDTSKQTKHIALELIFTITLDMVHGQMLPFK